MATEIYELTPYGKRYLDNPKTKGFVWKGKTRINLNNASQEQMKLLYNNGKGALVQKKTTSASSPSTGSSASSKK